MPFDEDPADDRYEIDLCLEEIKVQKARIKELEDVLEVYANEKNWFQHIKSDRPFKNILKFEYDRNGWDLAQGVMVKKDEAENELL